MKKGKYLVFFLILFAMMAVLIAGLMVGGDGGNLPQVLGITYGLLFAFFLLYSFDWLPKRKKNKNHPHE